MRIGRPLNLVTFIMCTEELACSLFPLVQNTQTIEEGSFPIRRFLAQTHSAHKNASQPLLEAGIIIMMHKSQSCLSNCAIFARGR